MKSCLYIIALFLLIIIIDVSIPNVTLSENNIELTPEEKAFVTGKKVRLGVDSARPPFEFIDEKGRYCGISAAFIELCSKSLGLHIVLVPGLNVGAAMKKLGEGEIDIIPKISPEPERAKDILFTKPYATFASVIVTRQDVRFISGIDNLEGLKVGVLKGLIVERRMKRDYPGLLLVSLPDVRTALVELSSGKIDAYIDNMGIVSYNIDKLALTNLKIAAQTPYVYDMSFGVRKDWPLMASALDKALAGISKQEKSSITSKWLTVEYQSSINWKVIGPAAAALIIVIAIILIWNRRLQRAVKQREAVQMELKEYALELQKQSAVKSKISQISTALQKTVTFEEFAEQLLSLAVPLLNSVYGIFYLYDNNMQLLKSVGSYGCIIKDNSFAIGQGLVGQCAAELAPININNLSDSNIRINFGSGQVLPRAISFQPILQKNELLGVIEIASLSNYGSDYQNIFNELMPIIAMNIEILKRNLHTKTLLIETQQLADKLQSQQEFLKETEIWYQNIIESAPDGIIVLNTAGVMILVNSMVYKLFRYERDELIGENVDILVPKALRSMHGIKRDLFLNNKVIAHPIGDEINRMGERKDGTLFPVEIGLSMLTEDGLREQCICATIRDISILKNSENELRKTMASVEFARQQMIDMSNSLPLAIFQLAVSPDGTRHYPFISSKVSEVLGVTAEEIQEDAFAIWENVYLDDLESTQQTLKTLFNRAAKGESDVSGEMIYRVNINGNICWAQFYACAKHLTDGRVLWNGFYQDITDRKAVEEEIRQHTKDLERFSLLTIDREERMIELKEEVNSLLELMNKEKKYIIVTGE